MADTIQKQGEISEKLNRLFEIVETLENLECGLKDDLTSVLRNEDKIESVGSVGNQQATDLGLRLYSVYSRLFYVVEGLQNIRDRIEL